jgi:NAD(P)-dependent dehydrogenase (short-subunit alcohol dehydrogenase family)
MDTGKKVCVLTGAGGVLGTEFCRRFHTKYSIVAVCGRRKVSDVPDQHHKLLDPLDPDGHSAANDNAIYTVHADLTQPGEIGRVVELALARFGRIDVLVNSAVHSVWASMLESDAASLSAERQFLTNVIVPMRLSVAIARAHWRDKVPENIERNRCIVNVSSIAGVNIYRGSGQGIYSASKAALNFLTCHMASEFAPIRVRVTGIAPNSFPGIVSTASVATSLDALIEGEMNGRLLVLDRDNQYYTP